MKTKPSRALYLVARFYAAAWRALLIGGAGILAIMFLCLLWIRFDLIIWREIGTGLAVTFILVGSFRLYRMAEDYVEAYPRPGIYRVMYKRHAHTSYYFNSGEGSEQPGQLVGTWMREIYGHSRSDASDQFNLLDGELHTIIDVQFVRSGGWTDSKPSPTLPIPPGKESIRPLRSA